MGWIVTVDQALHRGRGGVAVGKPGWPGDLSRFQQSQPWNNPQAQHTAALTRRELPLVKVPLPQPETPAA